MCDHRDGSSTPSVSGITCHGVPGFGKWGFDRNYSAIDNERREAFNINSPPVGAGDY